MHTAPLLNRVITHLEGQRDLIGRGGRRGGSCWTRRRAVHQRTGDTGGIAALPGDFEPVSEDHRDQGEEGYAHVHGAGEQRLTPEQIAEHAWQLVREVKWQREFNKNKMTAAGRALRGARSKWECLAVLAQYYPLKGVSQDLINRLVQELETTISVRSKRW